MNDQVEPTRDERISQSESQALQPYTPPEERIAQREHGVPQYAQATYTQPTYAQPMYGQPTYAQQPQAYSPGYGYAAPVRPPVSGGLVVVAWIIAFITFFYMLPWAVAVTRNRSNMAAIGLLNFLLGWSFIGWVVALVMACGSESQVTVVQQSYQQPYPAPGGYPPHHG
jgi:Superinfection immunity protein